MTREDAQRRSDELARSVDGLLVDVRTAHHGRLSANGWLLQPLPDLRFSGAAWLVSQAGRKTPPGLILVYSAGALAESVPPLLAGTALPGLVDPFGDVLDSTQSLLGPSDPVAVALVDDPEPSEPGRQALIDALRAGLSPGRAQPALVTAVELAERGPADGKTAAWGQQTADELVRARGGRRGRRACSYRRGG